VFDDGSDDLIREEDIDGVELFFVDKPKRSHRVDYSARRFFVKKSFFFFFENLRNQGKNLEIFKKRPCKAKKQEI
jgi:hypothetical protein